MKKLVFIFALIVAPVFSFAQEFSDEAVEVFRGRPTLPISCGNFSDPECWGRSVQSFCMRDPVRSQTGTCVPTDAPDERGVSSCRCL